MKTTAQKLIVIVTVAFFGLTAQAQNTRSFRMDHKMRVAEFLSEKKNMVKHEISNDLDNLKALIKYKPSGFKAEEFRGSEPMNEIASLVSQLEADVKYRPSGMSFDPEIMQTSYDFIALSKELEKTVKYNPAEALNGNNVEMDNILKELEKEVRYYPASII